MGLLEEINKIIDENKDKKFTISLSLKAEAEIFTMDDEYLPLIKEMVNEDSINGYKYFASEDQEENIKLIFSE